MYSQERIQYSPAVGVGKLGQVLELRFQVGLEPFSNELVENLGKWMGESNGPVSLGFAGILIRLGNPAWQSTSPASFTPQASFIPQPSPTTTMQMNMTWANNPNQTWQPQPPMQQWNNPQPSPPPLINVGWGGVLKCRPRFLQFQAPAQPWLYQWGGPRINGLMEQRGGVGGFLHMHVSARVAVRVAFFTRSRSPPEDMSCARSVTRS